MKAYDSNSQNESCMDKIRSTMSDVVSKSIIVHLPIDLTNILYDENHFPNGQNDQLMPVSFYKNELGKGFDLTGKNNRFCKTDAFHHTPDTRFIAGGRMYEKTISHTIPMAYVGKHGTRDVHCWHCTTKLKQSVGIPIKYEKDIFFVIGLFCSCSCALTFNRNSIGLHACTIQKRESLIRLMYKLSLEASSSSSSSEDGYAAFQQLEYAPPREVLKKFGGSLDFVDFHQTRAKVSIVYHPMIPLKSVIEENTLLSDVDANNYGKSSAYRTNLTSFIASSH